MIVQTGHPADPGGIRMSECHLQFIGEQCAALVREGVVVASAAGEDRVNAAVNLWAALLADHREDLAAIVAQERPRNLSGDQ